MPVTDRVKIEIMRKLLLLLFSVLLFSLSVNAQSEKSQMPVNKVDTIYLPFKNPFRKKAKIQKAAKVAEIYPQGHYLKKAGEYLNQSAKLQGLALTSMAVSGVTTALMADSDKPVWAVPIAFGGLALICEICSIHFKYKSGQMLIMSAGVNGATVSLNF